MTTPTLAPWRAVTTFEMRSGRGGLLGPDTDRRARWWEMGLTCGHVVERSVRYRPLESHEVRWNRTRSWDDVLPAPKRVRCEQCPKNPGRD